MNSLIEPVIFVIQTLGSLYLIAVLLRFVLQLSKADFYNPISQFIVRITKPLLMPLRRFIPGYGGIDFASLVLALLVQLALMSIILLISSTAFPDLLRFVGWAVICVAALFLRIYFFALLISVILSWVAPGSRAPGAMLIQQICEPALAPIRRIIPALGGLDLSPIFAFIAIHLLTTYVLLPAAIAMGMYQSMTIAL